VSHTKSFSPALFFLSLFVSQSFYSSLFSFPFSSSDATAEFPAPYDRRSLPLPFSPPPPIAAFFSLSLAIRNPARSGSPGFLYPLPLRITVEGRTCGRRLRCRYRIFFLRHPVIPREKETRKSRRLCSFLGFFPSLISPLVRRGIKGSAYHFPPLLPVVLLLILTEPPMWRKLSVAR